MVRIVPARIWLICGATFVTAAATAYTQTGSVDHPGDHHLIRVQDLPRPLQTAPADNPPQVIPRTKGMLPDVPAGFQVGIFADKLLGQNCPRTMAVAPNGDVFAVDSGNNQILVLRDANGDGRAETRKVFATRKQGLNLPFGIAFINAWLYVANTNGVIRYPYVPGQLKTKEKGEVVISGIPDLGYNQHWTRNLLYDPDRNKLYLTVGSQTNDAEEPPIRAAIHEYNPDGTGYRRLASGLRNPVGLALNPVTHSLWCTCNERDGLGDDLVPDYFTSVRDGGFYGWPYYYLGANRDPYHPGQHPELASQSIVPDVLLQAHSASLGCAFYGGNQFPEEYRGDAFIALHGSWNRAQRTGYKVVRVRFQDGQPVGGYDDFMTGFMISPTLKQVFGRPVGITVAADGALLVSDDGGHRIWRVSYPVTAGHSPRKPLVSAGALAAPARPR